MNSERIEAAITRILQWSNSCGPDEIAHIEKNQMICVAGSGSSRLLVFMVLVVCFFLLISVIALLWRCARKRRRKRFLLG